VNVKTFILFLSLSLILLPSLSFGGGFLIYNQDASASGVGLAFTAQADNPSAVFYNPAAINRLDGTNISSGGTLIMPSTSFRNAITGRESDMEHHIYLVPNIYLTHKFNDKLSGGIGIFSLFGLATEWPNDWEGRYLSTFAELRSFYVNPVISWQITPQLSTAFGLSFIKSDITQKKALSFWPLPVPDGRTKLEADGTSVGVNLALLYRFASYFDLGISYRSKVSVHYKGDVENDAPRYLSKVLPQGDVSVDIDLPPIVAVGIATSIIKNLTLEADIFWVGWSTYDELKADFENPVLKPFQSFVAPIVRDYHDVVNYSFGIKYRLHPSWTVRCGYLFDSTPVPEKAADPILPDANRNNYSIGLNYERDRMKIGLAYFGVFSRDRKVNNNLNGFNGKYESSSHLIAVNFEYRLR
jgi:long-chain fatty acid transport protein